MNGDLSLDQILQRLQTAEEAVAKAIAALIDENAIKFLSEIDVDELEPLLYLITIQKVTRSKLLDDFIKNYLILKVSVEGKRSQLIGFLAAGVGSAALGAAKQKGGKAPSITV